MLADAALAVVLAVLGELEVFSDTRWGGIGTAGQGPRPLEALLCLVLTLPLAARRRRPMHVALLVCAGLAVQVLLVAPEVSLLAGLLPLLIVLYSAGCHARTRWRAAALGAALVVQLLFSWRIPEERVGNEAFFGLFVMVGAFLTGEVSGSRQRTAEVQTRALQRELDAERAWTAQAVAEERAAIARELHDVIAHGVSVMGVQATAASVLVEADPGAARSAMLAIGAQARESIGELQRLLGVLRDAGEPAGLAPQPGLGQIPALVEQFREAGLPVQLQLDGALPALPAGVELAAYRVVQEALTNALRHAGAVPTCVLVGAEPDAVRVEVTDRGPRTTIRPGHGLIGMRERVSLYGGTLQVTAPDGGGVRVQARIPSGVEGVTTALIADDQELVRTGFRLILAHGAPAVDVVGEAGTGQDAVRLTGQLRPDVVLMDLRMPVMDGVEATRRIVASGSGSRILVLTTFDADQHVFAAFQAGASGFLLKNTAADRLVHAVHAVAAGDELLAPGITSRLVQRFMRQPAGDAAAGAAGAGQDGARRLAPLTAREREVLVLIGRGRSNREIAADLQLSVGTVKTHVNRILAKLGLRDRVQAVVLAFETGLVRP